MDLLNAHAIGNGLFEVFVDFVPTALCTEVEFPTRTRKVLTHQGGNMSRPSKAQSGQFSLSELTLRGITAYEGTDAAMFAYLTGARKMPPLGVIILIVLMDNLPRPRKQWQYMGCHLRDDKPNNLTGGGEDAAGFELVFEVEDLLDTPSSP